MLSPGIYSLQLSPHRSIGALIVINVIIGKNNKKIKKVCWSVVLPINCSLQKLEDISLSVALGAGKSLTFSFSNKQVTWARVDDLSSLTVS